MSWKFTKYLCFPAWFFPVSKRGEEDFSPGPERNRGKWKFSFSSDSQVWAGPRQNVMFNSLLCSFPESLNARTGSSLRVVPDEAPEESWSEGTRWTRSQVWVRCVVSRARSPELQGQTSSSCPRLSVNVNSWASLSSAGLTGSHVEMLFLRLG